MKKMYVLFDLDGTLTDSQEGIMNSILYMLDFYGIQVEDRARLRPWLGPPLKDSLMKYYDFPEEKALEGVVKYREYFDEKGIFENQVYPGIEKLLNELSTSGYRLCLATSKPELAARRIMEHFDLAKYFTFIGGASQDDSRVKKADVIRYVLDTCGITDMDRAVMVGDREHDVIGAKKNGLETIGVLFGYGSREELEKAGAEYIAETAEEIKKYLQM